MKTNPYKLTEYILFGLILAAAVTFFCVVITAMEWWPGVGVVAAVLVAVVLIFAGIEEWNQRKRQWDFAHAATTASPDDTVEFHPETPQPKG